MVITIIMKSLCKEDHGCEVLSNLWSLSLWLEKQHQSSIVKQLRMGSFSANSNFNCHVPKCFIFSVIPRIDDIGQLFCSSFQDYGGDVRKYCALPPMHKWYFASHSYCKEVAWGMVRADSQRSSLTS